MINIFSDGRLSDLLFDILHEGDPRYTVYIYRIVNGQPTRPALWKGTPYSELLEYLRDDHGGGRFQIMIRRGEKMILSGLIAIAQPLKPRVAG